MQVGCYADRGRAFDSHLRQDRGLKGKHLELHVQVDSGTVAEVMASHPPEGVPAAEHPLDAPALPIRPLPLGTATTYSPTE